MANLSIITPKGPTNLCPDSPPEEETLLVALSFRDGTHQEYICTGFLAAPDWVFISGPGREITYPSEDIRKIRKDAIHGHSKRTASNPSTAG